MQDKVDEGWLELRNAIIQQAIFDYYQIKSGQLKETGTVNKKEILDFFRNDCNGLMDDVEHLSGMDIFKKLQYSRKNNRLYKGRLYGRVKNE